MVVSTARGRRLLAGFGVGLVAIVGLAACKSSGAGSSSSSHAGAGVATTVAPATSPPTSPPTTAAPTPTTKVPKPGGGVSY
jgi:hypothetical protein